MQSAARIAVSIFLLTSTLATAYRDYNGAKLRRDGLLNLYPFPRVGRASHRTWQFPLNDLYLEYEPSADKRQLYAFPRVGRGDASLVRAEPAGGGAGARVEPLQAVPHRRNDSPGMWFGPRLGRAFKSEDDITIQNESSERSEPEQMEHTERKKRQIKPL